MSLAKHGKGYNSSLQAASISTPGFSATRDGISVSVPMAVRAPVNDSDIATKAYADSVIGGGGSLQVTYEGGNTITIDTATDGNVEYRDSSSNPVLTISETAVTAYKPLSMNTTNKVTDLAAPTAAADGATKAYVDALAASGVSSLQDAYAGGNTIDINTGVDGNVIFRDSGSSPVLTITETGALASAVIDLGSNKITNLAAPTNASDATTKTYVDGAYTFANVGAAVGEVFRDTTGTTQANFRTLAGTGGVAATNVGDIVQIGWSVGQSIIDASTFAGATADVKINAALATAVDGSVVIVDQGFTTSETIADQITFPAKNNVTLIFGKINFTYTNPANGAGATPSTSVKLFNIPANVSHITIKGAGQGTETASAGANLPPLTQFSWDAGAGNAYIANFLDSHYITIRDIRFTGKGQVSPDSGGIVANFSTTDGSWGHRFENVFIQTMNRNMIDIYTPTMCTFENLRLTLGGASAIYLRDGSSNTISRCYSSSMNQTGFTMVGTRSSTILSCASEGAGLAYLFDGTEAISMIASGAEENTYKDATYPGHGIRLQNSAKSTGIYNHYGRGMLSNVNQVYIDVVSAIGTDIINPQLKSDKTHVPTNSIVVGAGASKTRIVASSNVLLLPENGANTNALLDDSSTDTVLIYDGYFVNYGSRQRGPIFHDTVAGLRYLESDGAGNVSAVAWTPP